MRIMFDITFHATTYLLDDDVMTEAGCKVANIKAWKAAVECGLKEAKEFVESAEYDGTVRSSTRDRVPSTQAHRRVILSEAQFGRLLAARYTSPRTQFGIDNVEVLEPTDPTITDFSAN